MNAITKSENTALSVKPASQFDLSPQNFEQALTFSNYLAESELVPKDFKGKPGNCLIAMQWGAELGLKPLQALQNLAIINGRPALWGDAVIALVRSSPACEYVIEEDDGNTATCKVKRRGEPEQVRTFSMKDAAQAGLTGKSGPWSQYPKRMRQMRARSFALRDVFPDVLKGMPVAEEVMDMPKDMGPAQVVQPADNAGPTAQAASQALWDKALESTRGGMASYQAFWKSISKDERTALASDHEHMKSLARGADEERTLDAAPPFPPADAPAPTQAAPGKSFDEVMAMICAAKTEDELMVAGDWLDTFTDPAQRELLESKFDEQMGNVRGAA